MNKSLKLRIKPVFKNVDIARIELKRFCEEAYPGSDAADRTTDLCLAATEAMNNAVEHSGAGEITIQASAEKGGIIFQVITAGREFDPTAGAVSMPELGDELELPEGGFGLAIIKQLVDSVRFDYTGSENVLTLEKKIIS